MTTEDDFQAALDADTSDWQTRLVFADWLEEQGDPRAEGYRALGTRRRAPVPTYRAPQVRWWDEASENGPKGPDDIPRDWLDLIASSKRGFYGDYVLFDSRREAEDAAALAFAKLPARRRATLLETAPGGV